MKRTVHLFSILLLSYMLFSCDNNNNSNNDLLTTEPDIPAAQTIQPDLSPIVSFNNNQEKLNPTNAIGQNFIEARQRAAIIGSFLGLNAAFPASLIGAASSTDAEMTSPGVWEWNFMYRNPLTNGNVESNLIATIDADSGSVSWQLLLDANSTLIEFQDFEILNGISTVDGSAGQWDINVFSPETGNENVATTSEWSFNTDSLLTLTSTIQLEFSPLSGDEFSFEQQDSTSTLTFTDSSEARTTQITWKTADSAGQLIAPNFNNGETACWDANKEDIACDAIGF